MSDAREPYVACGAKRMRGGAWIATCTLAAGHEPALLHCDDNMLFQWREPEATDKSAGERDA